MEVKGITWAGNIYEKLQTMCLEVEEVIYEDTVKYVEGQMQRVGAGVNKFLEDLLPPPSCEDIQPDINKTPKKIEPDNHVHLHNKQVEVLDGNMQSEECSTKSRLPHHDLNVTTSSESSAGHKPREAVTKSTPISDQILSDASLKHEKEDSVAHDNELSPDDSETISSHEGNFDIDVIEAVEKSSLEESCIIVELDLVSQGRKNHKSYKKKICDALSLKLRPIRKQNHRVSFCEDEKNDPDPTDFGWELL